MNIEKLKRSVTRINVLLEYLFETEDFNVYSITDVLYITFRGDRIACYEGKTEDLEKFSFYINMMHDIIVIMRSRGYIANHKLTEKGKHDD